MTLPVWLVAGLMVLVLAACLAVIAMIWSVAGIVRTAIRYQYTASPPRPPNPPKAPAPAVPVSVPAAAVVPPVAGTGPTRIDRRAAAR